MPTVFLSYSREDINFVSKLAEDLKKTGIETIFDQTEIKSGDPIVNKISEAIYKADFVIACLSPNSVKSSWVSKELRIAVTREIECKRVIVLPILIDNIIKKDIPPFLSDKCYLDFRDSEHYHAGFQKLLSCLKQEIENKEIIDRYDNTDLGKLA